MKYWRGYLIAGLFSALGWALTEFAKSHTVLMDMVYPYMSRMIVSSMAEWSAGVDFCVWQVLLLVFIVAVLASAVLMIVLKWNPIQWFGWVTAAASLVYVLNLGVFGLNSYTGDLASDIRLEVTEYTVSELEAAAVHYRDEANALSKELPRDANGTPVFDGFSRLAEQAADGFRYLTYEEGLSVFAGSTIPVKELGLSGWYDGKTGITFGITGESAVNPDIPVTMLPFAMCREMARRMSIGNDRDADFAAFLTCAANSSAQFRYSGYLNAYRLCVAALEVDRTTTGAAALDRVRDGESVGLARDLEVLADYFGTKGDTYQDEKADQIHDLLVSWHIQEYVLPTQIIEEELFDPMDESQVDLTTTTQDITPTEEDEEETEDDE